MHFAFGRENAKYVELVESGRSFAKMEERKRKRREDTDTASAAPSAIQNGGGGNGGENGEGPSSPGVVDTHRRIRRRFKQSRPVADVGGGGGERSGMDRAVLKSVFGGGREKET